MAAPTATQVGSLGDGPNGNLTSIDKVTTYDAFFTDQWSVGRATFNLGLRFDHYDVWTPTQTQLPPETLGEVAPMPCAVWHTEQVKPSFPTWLLCFIQLVLARI